MTVPWDDLPPDVRGAMLWLKENGVDPRYIDTLMETTAALVAFDLKAKIRAQLEGQWKARVAVLEAENRRLRRELDQLRHPSQPPTPD